MPRTRVPCASRAAPIREASRKAQLPKICIFLNLFGGKAFFGLSNRLRDRLAQAWPTVAFYPVGRFNEAMRDFSDDHRWLSINTATLREQGDLLAIIEACKRHGIRGLSPWRDQVAKVGLELVAREIRNGDFKLSGYCRGGMFPSDASWRQEVIDDNRRAVDEAATLGAACLVLVVGGLPQFSRPGSTPSKDIGAARKMVEEQLGLLLEYAREVKVPLAIEPLHPMFAADRACVNTLSHALDLCEMLDPQQEGGIGVAVDVYHTWWDPELKAQIERAGKSRLLAFHVCDWLVPTRDLLNDRGMMGDGVIDIPQIRSWVEGNGFAGFSEVEIFSYDWWKRPIDQVLETCIERHRTCV